jgi:hypothetical protein
MKKVIERIFVGDKEDAPIAINKGFAVASMCKESPYGHRDMVGYKTLGATPGPDYYFVKRGKQFAANLIDVEDVNFIPEEVINPALDFIREHYDKGEKVLIRCERGHSRSPSTCLLFLRSIGEMPYSFKTAEKIMKTLYRPYDPSNGIRTYARTHWAELGNKNG